MGEERHAREAKVHTSWTEPDEQYEAAQDALRVSDATYELGEITSNGGRARADDGHPQQSLFAPSRP